MQIKELIIFKEISLFPSEKSKKGSFWLSYLNHKKNTDKKAFCKTMRPFFTNKE